MKKQILLGSLLSAGLGISSCTTERVVVERPAPPPVVVVKPVPPPHKTVYVDYDYRWKKGKYVPVPGRYIKVKPGKTWVPGHWEQTPKGYRWIPGHWK